MASVVQLSDLIPLVFSDVVDLSLARNFVRVLAANRVDVILGLVFLSSVEVSELVTALSILHRGSLLHFVGLLIQDKRVVCKNSPYLIFF